MSDRTLASHSFVKLHRRISACTLEGYAFYPRTLYHLRDLARISHVLGAFLISRMGSIFRRSVFLSGNLEILAWNFRIGNLGVCLSVWTLECDRYPSHSSGSSDCRTCERVGWEKDCSNFRCALRACPEARFPLGNSGQNQYYRSGIRLHHLRFFRRNGWKFGASLRTT